MHQLTMIADDAHVYFLAGCYGLNLGQSKHSSGNTRTMTHVDFELLRALIGITH